MSTYLVLGLGMQGTAAAHDLFLHGGAKRLILVDSDRQGLSQAAQRLQALMGDTPVDVEVHVLDLAMAIMDGEDEVSGALGVLFGKAELCMNCLPYRFSLEMTRFALGHQTHIADLGGNTAIVREQLAMAAGHENGKSVAVLPDCGLMPGMGNLFAAHTLGELGDCDSIHIRCCGLPTDPKPPLDYMLLFNVNGLINEYFGMAQVLRGGGICEVETFGELESIQLPMPSHLAGAGRDFEAFITSGGLSTLPWSFEGRVQDLDYKTVRYAGHHAKFELLKDLGLFEETGEGPPRKILGACLEAALDHPGDEDLAFLRCTARAGDRQLELEMFDLRDPQTGFTAMERSTAYSATACLYGVLIGKTKIGAGPIEEAVDTSWYLEALGQRGIQVKVTGA
ncbi:MAG: lysine 6-dehydrogenase [Planctomycetota bacterium]|jgi:lysine 6-dehydrogenase